MTSKGPETLFTDLVVLKLNKMLGEVKGTQVLAEVLGKLGKDRVETTDDLKCVAHELIARGGLTRMIGHALMTEALLRGARA